jgi:hypothetical protein
VIKRQRFRAINRAARDDHLGAAGEDSALSLLSALQQRSAAPAIVQQAKDRIARGHLGRRGSNAASSIGMWPEISCKLGVNVPLQSVLEQELAVIAAAETRAREGSPGAADPLATEPGPTAVHRAEIARLYQDLETRLLAPQTAAREKAVVASARQSFRTQIAANDIRQAKKALNALAGQLDSEDPFITRQASDAFASAYLR